MHNCRKCGVPLEIGSNWTEAMRKVSQYSCKPCEHRRRRPLGVITAAKPESQSPEHPELTRIRDERTAAYSKSDAADKRARDGFVYLIRIPGQVAVKIGHSRDPMQRIRSVKSFLVEDPEVVHMVYTDDRYADEQVVHEKLDKHRHHSGKELFYVGTEYATEVMNEYVGIRHRSRRATPGADNDMATDNSGGER